MVNELKEICGMLEGFGIHDGYQVLRAERNDDGTWELEIKRIAEEPKVEVAKNDNE